jgi:hypothetical protein
MVTVELHTSLEIGVILDYFSDTGNLFVYISKKSAKFVVYNVFPHHHAVDVDAGELFLNQPLDSSHTKGITANVAHPYTNKKTFTNQYAICSLQRPRPAYRAKAQLGRNLIESQFFWQMNERLEELRRARRGI